MITNTKIRQIRESKGIKQQVLADLLGISQPAYAKIENGETRVKVEDLLKIAQILETPLEDFLKDDLAIYNIQYNHNNDQPHITNFQKNDFAQECHLWEKLLSSKEAELLAEKKLAQIQAEEIKRLRGELSKSS